MGIFTSVTGTAPNRNFNIEWRAQYFPGSGNNNFEMVLHENTNCFDVIYGASADSGSAEESGVQGSPAGPALQFSCLTGHPHCRIESYLLPDQLPGASADFGGVAKGARRSRHVRYQSTSGPDQWGGWD